jgi:uncharacterized protein (TIGR02266 family)
VPDDPLFRNADRRRDPRILARIAVKFQVVSQAAKALNAFSVNFSAGGLCVRTKNSHPKGEQLALSLNIDGQEFDLKGTVAWVKDDVVGIRFDDVGPIDRARLELVARVLARTHPPAH